MAQNDLEDAKRLSPDERIRRLREIAKRNEEEIKKAQDLIKESEEELEEEEKSKRKIPIPQMRAVDVGTLFGKGTQEELMFRTKRFAEPRAREEEEETKAPLEKTVQEERVRVRAAAAEEGQRQYQLQLSREPIEELASRARSIYRAAKETGYTNREQMEDVMNITYAIEMKQADVRRGEYTPESDKFEEEISAFGGIIKALKDKYKGR